MRNEIIKKLSRLARRNDVDLWFEDECHFQQHGSRCTMWVPPEDVDPVVLHAPTRKNVGVFGAVCTADGRLTTGHAEKFNAETFLSFLQQLVRRRRKGRKRYDVSYQTIADACRRRLGLTDISQFRVLLRKWVEGDAKDLMELLKSNTSPSAHEKIEIFFKGHPNDTEADSQKSSISAQESQSEIISFRISKDIAKQLKVLAEMKRQSVGDLLGERVTKFVSEEIVNEFVAYIKGLGPEEADRVRKLLLKRTESRSQNEL